MRFNILNAAFVHDLQRQDHVRAFQLAQARQPELQSFTTLVSALEEVVGLSGKKKSDDGPRVDGLYRALLDEYANHPHPVWAKAIVLAFHPGRAQLKREALSSVHDDDELRDVVILGCLEAIRRVAKVRHRDRLPMRLNQAMRRYVFRTIGRAWRDRSVVKNLVTAAKGAGAMEPFASRRSAQQPHYGEMLAEMREILMQGHLGDDAEVANALCASGTLRNLMRLAHSELTAEDQEQLYQRVKKRKTRALARVRKAAERAADEALGAGTSHQAPQHSAERNGSR